MSIRSDFKAVSQRYFEKLYPGYLSSNCSWQALRRDRKRNGVVECGALVERPQGDHRTEVKIVPALLNQYFTGERPERAARDLWLVELQTQNLRLLALESRLEALTRVLESA